MPQLDPTWFSSQIFWLAVSFCVLYFVLARFMLPPLMETMARRKQVVSGDLEAAQGAKSAAEDARQAYERTLAEARSRSQAMVNDVMLQHKAKAEQASKELDAQIAAKVKDAEKTIAAAKQKLLDGLAPTATELASVIVEKLTQRAPSGEAVKSVVSGLAKRGGR